MNDIFINKKAYSFVAIKEGDFSANSTNEKHIFEFIQSWLNGQNEFTVFTSGSTGKPKAIVITREQMILSAEKTGAFLNLEKKSSALICLSSEQIAGKMMLVRTLELGLKATIIDPCANPFLKVNQSFNFTALVPMQVQEILSNKISSNLFFQTKNIIIGGAPLNNSLNAQLLTSPNNIYQTYGMTETVSHVALKNISKGEKGYQALPGVSFSIDNRNCLEIDAPMASPQQLTTNDIVELVSKTSFIWKSRIDFVINTGGIKVQIEELEQQLSSIFNDMNLSTDFFIFPQKDEKLGERVCLCTTQNKINLSSLLKEKLPKFHCPKSFYHLDSFVYNKSGKLNRKATIKKMNLS